MDVREKLVELIESARYWGSNTSEEIAENLISNGVTVQKWISVDDWREYKKMLLAAGMRRDDSAFDSEIWVNQDFILRRYRNATK